MSQEQMTKLHSDLINFGLNPGEWTLKRFRALHFKIVHCHDANFAFLGEVNIEGMGPSWQRVKLISL